MTDRAEKADAALFDEVEAYFEHYIPTAEDSEWGMYQAYHAVLDANEEKGDDRSIACLHITPRSIRCLLRAGIKTIQQLKDLDLRVFKGITRNFGEGSMRDVESQLRADAQKKG